MASLIENLIVGLNEEYAVYEQLLEVSMEKTSAIVSNDLERLRTTTDKEQLYVDTVTGLERKRVATMNDIANVLGKRGAELKVTEIVEFLEGQPEFRNPLLEINEKLSKLAKKLRDVNAHNQRLIKESLSMIEYNINLLQNLNRAPETAEYSKDMFKHQGGYGTSAVGGAGKFDAMQ